MSTPPPATERVQKLLSSARIKIRVLAVALIILILGAWLAPPRTGPITAPQERPAPLLEAQVQQRAPEAVFSGIQELVRRLSSRGVAVVPAGAAAASTIDEGAGRADDDPPAFGVVVSDTHVVTHVSALDGARAATVIGAAGSLVQATVAAFDPVTNMLLLATNAPAGGPPAFADTPAQVGSIAIAAAQWRDRDVTDPLFVTSVAPDRYRVSWSPSIRAAGLPIYNAAGELIAVSGGGVAWRARFLLDRLQALASGGGQPSALGLEIQHVDNELRRAVGGNGLIVVRVVPDGPADAAGIREGDVITAVRDVDTDTELAGALAALPIDTPAAVTIRRARRSIAVEVTPAPAFQVAGLARSSDAPRHPHAQYVFAADTLAAAAVSPSAQVIAINGRNVASRAEAARELAASRGTALVLFDHRGERFYRRIEAGR